MAENKKRKFNQISKKPDLHIKPIASLPCQCCGDPTKNYKLCTNNMVYCSEGCRSVLVLSRKDGYLDEQMKETKTFFEALDAMEMHIDENLP